LKIDISRCCRNFLSAQFFDSIIERINILLHPNHFPEDFGEEIEKGKSNQNTVKESYFSWKRHECTLVKVITLSYVKIHARNTIAHAMMLLVNDE
jgi:hypothetical protein